MDYKDIWDIILAKFIIIFCNIYFSKNNAILRSNLEHINLELCFLEKERNIILREMLANFLQFPVWAKINYKSEVN